jgi:hypothetical protein
MFSRSRPVGCVLSSGSAIRWVRVLALVQGPPIRVSEAHECVRAHGLEAPPCGGHARHQNSRRESQVRNVTQMRDFCHALVDF